MTSWQLVRLFAGTFILLSLALGIPGSPIFVSPWWLAFTAFVGANLLQSALTKWCLMETHPAQARRARGRLNEAAMKRRLLSSGRPPRLCGAAAQADRRRSGRRLARRADPRSGIRRGAGGARGRTGAARAGRVAVAADAAVQRHGGRRHQRDLDHRRALLGAGLRHRRWCQLRHLGHQRQPVALGAAGAAAAVQPRARRAASASSSSSADVADLEWRATQQTLMLRTAERYFDAALAAEALRVLRRQQEAVERALTEVRDRFKLGDVPVTDTHEAAARAEGRPRRGAGGRDRHCSSSRRPWPTPPAGPTAQMQSLALPDGAAPQDVAALAAVAGRSAQPATCSCACRRRAPRSRARRPPSTARWPHRRSTWWRMAGAGPAQRQRRLSARPATA